MTYHLLFTADWGDVITLLDRDRLVITLADTRTPIIMRVRQMEIINDIKKIEFEV